ncbi:site-specific DNA-methyltransferase [Pontibacter arcticus]|uniref:site-specific DNA-methyltransferase (adenine-specific) n=1 Tax=Pontibacter arcticus TaxID=2080288 RepID=A0A364RAW0_9BACT|nr:site-specific DNA-methyltransferase [Pontibacter arcticus]RAU81442.1 site-specific DNA-methyltransferase [Pontibacter arcticus]RAU81445.1 site-specific DNA-methyltransferase [Pontibacter arcticus]
MRKEEKHKLINKLKSLESLSTEERSYLIDLLNQKKYGLVWEDKPEAVEEQLRQHLPVLEEVAAKAIVNGEEHPNHILIEGDNLHALTALTFTHEGKVDVIYIDPPYNTGKENEFRYNDKWILKDHPFKHSLWLNFISKRLSIAKKLLSKTGVMVIHIDENEFDALNLLLETEIFSEEDFLGAVIWNKQNPKGDAKGVATMHEYVLIYAKDKQSFTALENALSRSKPNAVQILNKAKKLYSKIGKTEIPDAIKEVIKPFNFSKEALDDFKVTYDLELVNKEFQSWLNRQDFSGGEKAYKFIDENGFVYQSVSMAWPNKEQAPDDYYIPLTHPITRRACPVPSRGWRNPSKTMESLLERNLILFGDDESTQPRRKYLLEENLFENTPSIYNNGSSDDELFKTLEIEFPYPKPVSASKYFLQAIHPNPKIILDFFAGSGTTLHATMQLNAEDGGKRQCILVTNNENNICEEVTYERNRRVIQGYTNSKGQEVAGLTQNNLRYYKSGFVPSMVTEPHKRMLTQHSTELLCIKEDCYIDLTEANGFNPAQCRLFSNGKGKHLTVVYHSRQQTEVCEQLIGYIKGLQSLAEPVRLYAFSPEKETLAEDFWEVADKIEAVPLPEAIYNAYKATFRVLKLDRKSPTAPVVEAAEADLFATTQAEA